MPKGDNPNSHNNKPKFGAKPKTITLAPDQWLLIKAVGDGNNSRGVRRLIEVLYNAKLAIACLLENQPNAQELAESVLLELEDLEIEQAYKEANIKPTSSKDAYIL